MGLIGPCVGLIAVLGACSGPMDDARQSCVQGHAGAQVTTCTALIEHGGYKGPELAKFFSLRGAGHAGLREFPQALGDMNQSITIAPEESLPYFSRGLVEEEMGRHEDAIADFDKSISLNPKFAEGYFARGLVFAGLHQQNRAILEYDTAIGIKPDYVEAIMAQADSYKNLGEVDKQRKDLDLLVAVAPQRPGSFIVRSFVRAFELKDLPGARADCDEAQRLLHAKGNSYLRGQCAYTHGNYAESLADENDALKHEPRSAPALIIRAFSKYHQGDLKGGSVDLVAAKTIDHPNKSQDESIGQ